MLAAKEQERTSIVALYRRGRIDEKMLDMQLDQIVNGENALRVALGEMKEHAGRG